MRASELTWAAGVLEAVAPSTDVLGLRVDTSTMLLAEVRALGEAVELITVDVHVCTTAQAQRLAEALRLGRDHAAETRMNTRSQASPGCPLVWWCWSGWVAEGSRQAPVRMEVTAADTAAAPGAPEDAGSAVPGAATDTSAARGAGTAA